MKKFELVAAVAKKTGLTQDVVNKVIDGLCPVIVEACVEKGDEVNLPSFGKFRQKVNSARKGLNPLTGKKIDIPESHTLKFTASSSLKVVK